MANSQLLLYFHRVLSTLYILCWLLGWASSSWDGTEGDRRTSPSHRLFPRLGNSPSNLSYVFGFATESFVSSLEATIEQLNSYHRPLLVHTRNRQSDELLFVRESGENFTVPIVASSYSNLKAISHLPVTAVAIALPEIRRNTSATGFSNETLQRLAGFQQVLNQGSIIIQSGTFEPGEQSTRQTEIVEATSQFVAAALQSEVSMETVSNLVQLVNRQQMANARDAVRDYLICLNDTITTLLVLDNITSSEWQTLSLVVALEPFAVPRSFIVQYYEQLLNVRYNVTRSNSERIILLPIPKQPLSASTISLSSSALSVATLFHNISRLFYSASNPYTPIHQLLSNAASEIVCSSELEFPSCGTGQQNQLPPGFETTVERVYVIVIIYTSAAAIVLAIVVLCICIEDKRMKGDLRRVIRKYEGPTVFTPLDVSVRKRRTINLDQNIHDSSIHDSLYPLQSAVHTL